MNKEQLKLYNKEKLIDIIEKLSIEFAVKNQQYEYIRHNDYSNELQQRIEKAIKYLKENACYIDSNIFVDDLCCDECMGLLNILEGKEGD